MRQFPIPDAARLEDAGHRMLQLPVHEYGKDIQVWCINLQVHRLDANAFICIARSTKRTDQSRNSKLLYLCKSPPGLGRLRTM